MRDDARERRPGSWNRASLVIQSDDLTPDDISSSLALQPTSSGVRGTKRTPSSAGVRETNVWSLRCPLDDETRIEDQIAWLLDAVEPHRDELANLVAARGCYVRIQAAVRDKSGQYPMTFDAELLRRLSAVPLVLWLTASMQSPSEDDGDTAST